MISNLAFKFVTSTWGRYLIVFLALLSALFAWGRMRERGGRDKAVQRHVDDIQTRTERGKDAYHKRRRETSGDDVGTLIDGMRRRDSHLGRMPDIC